MMSVNVYYHVDRACKLGPYSRTYLHLTMRDVTNRYYRTSWPACIHEGKISSGKCLSCEAIVVEDKETINLNIISSNSRQKLDLKCLKGDISDSLKYGSSDEPLGICISENIDEHNVRSETIAHLQICVNALNLMQGKVHHAMIIEYGIENEVESLLVQMYAKCRAVDDALMLFDTMHEQSTVLWNLIITIHLREGKLEASLLFYDKMQQMSVMATKVTYICMLSACTSKKYLVSGMLMHARIIACRFITDVVVTTSLVNMYGSCGHLDHAYRVFDNAEECDVISWNAMIGVYRQHGLNEEALLLFNRMQVEGISPNKVTFISILDVCAQRKSLGEGKNIQLCMMGFELKSDVSMCTAVINMYGKCGYLDEANFLFNNFEEKDIVLWNSMLALYSQRDEFNPVFRLLEQMTCEGFMPTKITYVSVFNACANKEALGRGKWVHASIVNSSFGTDLEVGNAILNFYRKHQSLLNAKCMFERITERNVITWSGMIAAYAQDGQSKEAVQIFIKMQQERVMPNEITLISILQAFDNKSMLDDIRKTHYYAMLEGFNKGVTLGTALINMYSKYGNIKEARSVFDEIPKCDILCWTAIISSYIQHRQQREALLLFNLMKKGGILPDKVAIINILSACSSLMTFSECEEMFACIHQCQLELDEVVGSAVLSIYGRFGKLKLCMGLFEKLPKKYVSTWNSMIAAYVQNGQFKDALHLFEKMNDAGVIPDKDSFVSTLAACASEASLIEGKKVHDIIRKCGFILNDVMTCALISMYGKCGCLGFSESVFGNIEKHDVLSWNAMIGVYAQHGESFKAIQLVEQMQQKGIMPDTITMVSILNAMSHTGLLHEAFHCILLMENSYNIIPSSDHYVCIMDLIRRAGRINEVGCFIRCMPFQPKTVSYMSFLGACQCSIFLEHGEFAAKHMSELDPKNAGPYVSLSNIYATIVEE